MTLIGVSQNHTSLGWKWKGSSDLNMNIWSWNSCKLMQVALLDKWRGGKNAICLLTTSLSKAHSNKLLTPVWVEATETKNVTIARQEQASMPWIRLSDCPFYPKLRPSVSLQEWSAVIAGASSQYDARTSPRAITYGAGVPIGANFGKVLPVWRNDTFAPNRCSMV